MGIFGWHGHSGTVMPACLRSRPVVSGFLVTSLLLGGLVLGATAQAVPDVPVGEAVVETTSATAVTPTRAKKARWMGPSLKRLVANNPYTCREQPRGIFTIPSLADTCTWIGIGTQAGNGLDGYLIPKGGGRVTAVQIKVGNVTGPMQLVVVRAMRKRDELNGACCFYRARSKVFTPRPNSITTVRVNFVMEHSYNRTSKIWSFDSLGLSVLDGSTPMPAYFTGSAGGYRDPGVAGFYPHISNGRESRADGIGISGYQMLMRARYIPN